MTDIVLAYWSRHKPIPEGWEHHDDLVGHPSRVYAFLIRQVDETKPLPPRKSHEPLPNRRPWREGAV